MDHAPPSGFSREDGLGLFVAVAVHAAVIAALTLSPLGRHPEPPPQRMVVSFAPAIADQSASPKPDAQAQPDLAPTLGEPPPADKPEPVAPPVPEPVVVPKPVPKPAPVPKPVPLPKPVPAPKPVPKPVAKPLPKPEARPEPKPAPKPTPKAAAKPVAKPAGGEPHAHPAPAKPTGGSKIDDKFLAGIAGATSPGTDKVSPGEKPAGVSNSSLSDAITRQLVKPWNHLKPSGVDIEKLVAVLSWTMNPDGSLASEPIVLSVNGQTPSNRPQAALYGERAVSAVKQAAPFTLPPEAYKQWKRIRVFTFRYNLPDQEKR